jgi:hypothetical protein
MSTVVEVTEEGDGDGDANPLDGPRIEVEETAARRASFPAVWLGRAKTRLNEVATRLTYGELE